ncbi:cell wall hydrolase [Desulforamulus aeronauticus]|uniref:LysM domain-containing protein n=1 Tax=Desulforamulus aeronauticus DSM 10349 TaxID=1121421 RepID=A0A1M6SAQ5_9FIRM|nr:cell wall hydrolase [Desulforamulus aeronauticus]SHK41597.1 LysM domain-containing protein [Desulforamulus aeronauticus DSM 10349]
MKFFVRFKRAIVLVCLLGLLVPATAVYAYQYTVTLGDSLYTISQKNNISIDKIKSANNLSQDLIHPGQVLNIPDKQSLPAETKPAATQAQPANSTYTVQPGDSLYVIAEKNGLRPESLMLANSLSGTLIYPGQQLIVPIAATRSTTPMAAEVSRSAKRPVIPFTDEDLDLLSRLVTAEAGGEPVSAQVGVAAVVLNRVKSSTFQNTIRDVIYAPNQFSPVRNGWINRPATSTAIEAAKDALYGNDPTNGALYFFDNSASNSFLRSLPVSAKYGQMIYATR